MTTPINHHASEETDLAGLYERHAARIRAFITRLTSDPEAAEDLCHDTFLKALRGWSGRRQTDSTIAWLYQIARNTAYDYMRLRQGIIIADLNAADAEVGDDQIAHVTNHRIDLLRLLASLPPQTRLALMLFGAGYRTQEIAAMSQTSDSAVKHIILRGRAWLRAQAAR